MIVTSHLRLFALASLALLPSALAQDKRATEACNGNDECHSVRCDNNVCVARLREDGQQCVVAFQDEDCSRYVPLVSSCVFCGALRLEMQCYCVACCGSKWADQYSRSCTQGVCE